MIYHKKPDNHHVYIYQGKNSMARIYAINKVQVLKLLETDNPYMTGCQIKIKHKYLCPNHNLKRNVKTLTTDKIKETFSNEVGSGVPEGFSSYTRHLD